ncbi:hypothetical protein ES708_12510 [subsurface metagenome]
MKINLVILLYLANTAFCAAQIGFTYDDAGNRESRYLIELKSTDEASEEADKQSNFSISEKRNILVFPNPTEGLLAIEIIDGELDEGTPIQMNIYTLKGDLITSKEYASKTIEIDLSDQPPGTYLLDLNIGEDKHNFMIVKD